MSVREEIKSIDILLLIIFGVPSTVLGIGLIKFFNTPSLDFIYGSFWIIIIAYLGKFVFISHKLIGNAINQIPKSLEESAQIMGANFFIRMRMVVLPLIADKLFIVFIIGFIFSLGELGATILVYPAGSAVMGIKLYTIMANAPQTLVSAMSLVILLVTVLLITILTFIYTIVRKRKMR
jgi:ABC-type Fe3+ transport system permease subunit